MPREHWNDTPGDIAGGEVENLPGGFGIDDPDNNIEAVIDEISNNDETNAYGLTIAPQGQRGGDTAGTSYAAGTTSGSTIDPRELVEGEESHPGAGVGFTGGEMDKRVPPPAERSRGIAREEMALGGVPDEARTAQQQEMMSVETEGPAGGQGAAGANQPRGKRGK